MEKRDLLLCSLIQRDLFESGLQDRPDAFVALSMDSDGPFAGHLQSIFSVRPAQPEKTETGAVGLFRIGPAGKDCFDNALYGLPHGGGPPDYS